MNLDYLMHLPAQEEKKALEKLEKMPVRWITRFRRIIHQYPKFGKFLETVYDSLGQETAKALCVRIWSAIASKSRDVARMTKHALYRMADPYDRPVTLYGSPNCTCGESLCECLRALERLVAVA